ncbi:uncharacterized protein LOC132385734 isoform X2 [Hypanus sabinus]|uniref:uncharacterized protein LOC132385734 isoform X2 n=1 Tax=Hypanus sabinus TaxID=79690 RepID=UPI0028C3D2F8|nr:uncharacterized protein LOC132385734 isoform X2 [Hypanus sabinus]
MVEFAGRGLFDLCKGELEDKRTLAARMLGIQATHTHEIMVERSRPGSVYREKNCPDEEICRCWEFRQQHTQNANGTQQAGQRLQGEELSRRGNLQMLEIQATTHTKCWWNTAGQAASIGRSTVDVSGREPSSGLTERKDRKDSKRGNQRGTAQVLIPGQERVDTCSVLGSSEEPTRWNLLRTGCAGGRFVTPRVAPYRPQPGVRYHRPPPPPPHPRAPRARAGKLSLLKDCGSHWGTWVLFLGSPLPPPPALKAVRTSSSETEIAGSFGWG